MKRTYIFASAPYAQAWCALSNKISHGGNESKHMRPIQTSRVTTIILLLKQELYLRKGSIIFYVGYFTVSQGADRKVRPNPRTAIE